MSGSILRGPKKYGNVHCRPFPFAFLFCVEQEGDLISFEYTILTMSLAFLLLLSFFLGLVVFQSATYYHRSIRTYVQAEDSSAP